MTQSQALDILKTGANVFLTGEPGAGKTHTINAFVGYLRANFVEPAITASTGIAATHIGGMTIHSWSGLGIKNKFQEEVKRYNAFQNRVLKINEEKQIHKDIDVKSYIKYLLKEGSMSEKREILSCIKSKIVIRKKILNIEQQ